MISQIFYPILYNRCDKLFSNSIYINQDLRENFKITIPMDVIYNPIIIPKATIHPSSLSQEFPVFKLITVGSVDKRKNQIMVIRALRLLYRIECSFDIYGAGPLEKYLGKQIECNGLMNKVFLKGRAKNIDDYLLKSHCFILSSFTEGFPNVLLEAMAIGLPCISTNCLSGPLELLHQQEPIEIPEGGFFKAKYGILVNNDDHIGLSKAISYLANKASERERFSRLSLERAKDYELDKIYTKFNQFITS